MFRTLLRDPATVPHAFTVEFADGTDQEQSYASRAEATAARQEADELKGPEVRHVSHVYRQDRF